MSDEIMPQDADEVLDQAVEAAEEQAADVAEAEAEVAEELPVEAAEEAAEEAVVLDERVEAAVRHVAEEAEADEADEAAAAATVAPEPVEETHKKRERRSKQARAAKQQTTDAPAPAAPAAEKRSGKLGTPAWLGICACSLVLGLLLGRFVLGGGSSAGAALGGSATIEESKLADTVYATYTYNGATESLSVQDVLDASGQAESYSNGDGTYTLPPAEVALSAARNKIVTAEMDARGIEAKDEDVDAFVEQQMGMSDYDALAEAYGVDAETLKEQATNAYRLDMLRKEVIDAEMPEQVAAPTQPEEGKESEATKEYADYIFELAGDEWNAKKGKWADESSAYATALADFDISEDGATYEAAQAAYYVAYQQYTQASAEYNQQWTDFLNGLMVNASISVSTLSM